jgi:hypothetical protein
MASNLNYKTTLRNAHLDAITAAIGSNGLLRMYSGTQPADADTGLSGNTLLAELALSSTAAPSASGGVLTLNSITPDSSADNSGTATWGSLTASGGTRIVDFSIGTSGADLNLNTVSIIAGAQVSVSSFAITAGNA